MVSSKFVPPHVIWMGRFAYKAVISIRAGKVTDVEVSPVRGGVDSKTNEELQNAIAAHVRANYQCAGDHTYAQAFVFALDHDVPPLMSDLLPELKAHEQALAAWQAASGAKTPTPDPRGWLKSICPRMDAPVMPLLPSNEGSGLIRLHVLFDVRGGTIGNIDARLQQGSPDFATNQLFIDSAVATIRNGYQCTGTHLLEQEFQFHVD